MNRPRVMVDANVIVSAGFGGTPAEALRKARGFTLLTTDRILEEVRGAIERLAKNLKPNVHARLLDAVAMTSETAMRVSVLSRVRLCRDVNDDHLLEACFGGRADVLLTGDRDLSSIARADLERVGLRGLDVLTPREFLEKRF